MVTAAQIWRVYGEEGVDPEENVADRQELIEQLAKMDFSRELAKSASTPVLREVLRFLQEHGATSINEEGEEPDPMDRDAMNRDEEMSCGARRHSSFDEGADNLRRSMDYGPQHTGMANYGFDPRKTSREGWSAWQNASEKDLRTMLKDAGVQDYQLDSMSKQDMGKMAGQIVQMTDSEMKEFLHRQYDERRVPSPASPEGVRAGNAGDAVSILKSMQRSTMSSTRKFSERGSRSRPMNRIAALNKHWERFGEQLENVGERYADWEAIVKNPNVTDGEVQRMLSGKA